VKGTKHVKPLDPREPEKLEPGINVLYVHHPGVAI